MKGKIFTLLAVFCIAFTSCSKEDENTLSGTKWVSTYYDDGYFIFEFGSNTITGYVADDNFIIDGKTSTTTYYIDGDNIVFDELIIDAGWHDYRFTNAVLSGSVITADREMGTSSYWGSALSVRFTQSN